MSEEIKKEAKTSWSAIIGVIAFGCTVLLLLGALVWAIASDLIEQHQYTVRTDAMETQLKGMKEGQFITDSYYHAKNYCFRFAWYIRTGPYRLVLVHRRADGSLDTNTIYGDDLAETISPSCSPADIAAYRDDLKTNLELQQDALRDAADARRLAGYVAFFKLLKKGDRFTVKSEKYGPAFCYRFIGIDSVSSSSLSVATLDWNGPSTNLVFGSTNTVVRGCISGSSKFF